MAVVIRDRRIVELHLSGLNNTEVSVALKAAAEPDLSTVGLSTMVVKRVIDEAAETMREGTASMFGDARDTQIARLHSDLAIYRVVFLTAHYAEKTAERDTAYVRVLTIEKELARLEGNYEHYVDMVPDLRAWAIENDIDPDYAVAMATSHREEFEARGGRVLRGGRAS